MDQPSHRNLRRLCEAQNWRCAYCGVPVQIGTWPSWTAATRDHVVPLASGGASDWNNVVVACWACNAVKGADAEGQCFARRRRAWAEAGRWPPGRRLFGRKLARFLTQVADDEADALLGLWRLRRGIAKPRSADRRVMEQRAVENGLSFGQ